MSVKIITLMSFKKNTYLYIFNFVYLFIYNLFGYLTVCQPKRIHESTHDTKSFYTCV